MDDHSGNQECGTHGDGKCRPRELMTLALGALGVVYGDIGT